MTSPLANPEENSGKYQGDIVLDDFIIDGMLQEYAQGRNAYTWPNTKWPNDTVVWEFGEGEFGKSLLLLSILYSSKQDEDSSVLRLWILR